ncbi:MAG: zinc ribbon domain-containing protein [Planctomycetota bacterium]|jgi:hypothetical protein
MSDEKIVVQCHCGKKYKASAAKVGKKMKCKACGEAFTVQPAGAAAPTPAPEPAPVADVPAPEFGAPTAVAPEFGAAPSAEAAPAPEFGAAPAAPETPAAPTPQPAPADPNDETGTMPQFAEPAPAAPTPEVAPEPDTAASAAGPRITLPEEEDESDVQDVVDRPAPPKFRLKPANKLKLDPGAKKLNPDDLMKDIQVSQLNKTLAIAIVIHLVLLGVTSISFIPKYLADAKKYKSYDLAVIKEAKKAEEDKKKEDERKALAMKRRKEREEKLKKIQEAEEAKKKKEEEEKQKRIKASKTGKEATEIIKETPTSSGVNLFGGEDEL